MSPLFSQCTRFVHKLMKLKFSIYVVQYYDATLVWMLTTVIYRKLGHATSTGIVTNINVNFQLLPITVSVGEFFTYCNLKL